jgi:hypothetical protein
MANNEKKPRRPSYGMDCVAIPSPPGKKFRGKHLLFDEPPSMRRWWVVTSALVTIALGIGMVVGRFLLR